MYTIRGTYTCFSGMHLIKYVDYFQNQLLMLVVDLIKAGKSIFNYIDVSILLSATVRMFCMQAVNNELNRKGLHELGSHATFDCAMYSHCNVVPFLPN